jgi:hypothetical protein
MIYEEIQHIKMREKANEDSQRAMSVIAWLAFFAMCAFFGVLFAAGWLAQWKEAI